MKTSSDGAPQQSFSRLPPHPHMDRGMSLEFNPETGAKESSQMMWEGSSWERLGCAMSAMLPSNKQLLRL